MAESIWTIETVKEQVWSLTNRLDDLDAERKALRRVIAGLEAWLEIAKRNAALAES